MHSGLLYAKFQQATLTTEKILHQPASSGIEIATPLTP